MENTDSMSIRGGGGWQNTSKFKFELAPKLIPFSWLSCFQKHKNYLPSTSGSVSPRHHFLYKIYKGNPKKYKGNCCSVYFPFVTPKNHSVTHLRCWAAFLRS